MVDNILVFAIVAAIVYGMWRLTQPRWDIHITVRKGVPQIRKGIAVSKKSGVQQFLQEEAKIVGPAEIFARRDPNGRLRTKFRGKLDVGQQQQIRNYLVNAK